MKKKRLKCAWRNSIFLPRGRYLFVSAVLWFTVLFSVRASAQGDRNITINKQKVPFEEIVRCVESQTDYSFMYSTETVRNIGTVSVNVTDVTIKQLLDIILAGKPCTYEIEDHVVIIKTKDQEIRDSV